MSSASVYVRKKYVQQLGLRFFGMTHKWIWIWIYPVCDPIGYPVNKRGAGMEKYENLPNLPETMGAAANFVDLIWPRCSSAPHAAATEYLWQGPQQGFPFGTTICTLTGMATQYSFVCMVSVQGNFALKWTLT